MPLTIGSLIPFYVPSPKRNGDTCIGEVTATTTDTLTIATDAHCAGTLTNKQAGATILAPQATSGPDPRGYYLLMRPTIRDEKLQTNIPHDPTETIHIDTLRQNTEGAFEPLTTHAIPVTGLFKMGNTLGVIMRDTQTIYPGDSGARCLNDKNETVGRLSGIVVLDKAKNRPAGRYIFCAR